MTDVEKLLAIEEIKQLKARYFHCMDTKNWTGFGAVFAPDALLDSSMSLYAIDPQTGTAVQSGEEVDAAKLRDDSWIIKGADAIRDAVKKSHDDGGVSSVHHGHMPVIEILSPDSARGVWSMEDVLRFAKAGKLTGMVGYGHYTETYRRIDGAWHIQSLRLTRLRIDLTYAT